MVADQELTLGKRGHGFFDQGKIIGDRIALGAALEEETAIYCGHYIPSMRQKCQKTR